VYFVENLTLRNWLFSLLPHLLWEAMSTAGKIDQCYVFDGSDFALLMAKATSRIVDVPVEKLKFRLIDIRDDKGLLIRLRITYQDLVDVQADAMKESVFCEFVQDGRVEDRLPTYLAKYMIGTNVTERETLWRMLFLVQVCARTADCNPSENNGVVLFLERRPWLDAVSRYAARYRVRIVPVMPALNFRVFLRRVLTPKGIATARIFRDRLYLLRSSLHSRRKKPSGDTLRTSSELAIPFGQQACKPVVNGARVAVEYHGQFNLKQPQLYSDFFFWQQSALQGNDILVTFGLSKDPLDKKKCSELSQCGAAVIALDPRASTIPAAPIFTYRPTLGVVYSGRRRFNVSGNGVEKRWLSQQTKSYYVLRDYWTKLFASQNVKVYVTWSRYDARHCAIADALQSLGGIMVIYQRALQLDPSATITVNADIMFGYSPTDALVEKRSASIIPYHVAVGYFGDHFFTLLREEASNMRNAIRQHGTQYIMAFFDENSLDDSRWHTGHEFQQENYAFLLEKVLLEPWLGLVIKPKVPSTLRRRLGPVAELLQRAVATGRCHVYEEGPLHGSYPPAVAALASDVAVHGHLCAGTAGLEAALAGVPTLLLDREGWHVSPLYRLGVGRVVFTDWQTMWEACVQHRANPSAIPDFGDWSPMIEELDPFRDGHSAERMGTYIKWLIEGFKLGLDRDTVMTDAAERYCAKWGKDKVTEVNVR
jgi:hypothetical protein